MFVRHLPEPLTTVQIVLPDEAATLDFASRLAHGLRPGLLIFLQGDLGAGKTTFSRGVLRGLGVAGRIKSPTYTLVEPYDIAARSHGGDTVPAFSLYHFDVYRFADPREWLDAGFDELLNPHSVALVEWPDKAAGCLPCPDIVIRLTMRDAGRDLQLSVHTQAGATCLSRLDLPTTETHPTPTSTS